MITYKDNKLTYLLKPMFKEYNKINLIFHISITENTGEQTLRTLEESNKMKMVGEKKNTNPDENTNAEGEIGEFSVD